MRFIHILKTAHLQQLNGMQRSKLGMWKGYHLSIEGIWKGYFFSQNWYIIEKGLGPEGATSPSEREYRELKQQRRRRLRKRELKSEVALLQTLSHLFHLVQFVKCWQFFLELNFKRLYWRCCLVFTFSTKREINYFHVVVVQWRQRNVQKNVMHVQSCCFASLY